jgi:hypothetical protein
MEPTTVGRTMVRAMRSAPALPLMTGVTDGVTEGDGDGAM